MTFDKDGEVCLDKEGKAIEEERKDKKQNDNGETLENVNGHGYLFAEVSENMYNTFFKKDSCQASVYITSYAKTDAVIKALRKNGYDAVSTIRVGSGEYEDEKVQDRLRTMGTALAVLFVLGLAEILIVRSFMKIQMKDQWVLKNMGMQTSLLCRINYVEMFRYGIVSVVLSVVGLWGVSCYIRSLQEMLYYYVWPQYSIYLGYNMLVLFLAVVSYNRLLRKKVDK